MKKSRVIFSLLVLGFVILMVVIWQLLKSPEIKPVRHTDSQTMKNSASNSPIFRKDGELSFLDGRTNKTIIKIDIEIADNENSRIQGLMYRDSLPATAGMLFLMESEEPQAFWMRNTKIPLDIIYADAGYRIVKICRNTLPYSEATIPSEKPALYVVEVNAGFSEQYQLKEGDRIVF